MRCSLVILVLCNTSFIAVQSLPLLLLVSFDGFRHDYPELYGPLKNFHRLEQRGVRARDLIPSFASATFPNHYSLVTGLYQEVHGVMSNQMFDPKLNLTFEAPYKSNITNWWPYPAIWSVNEQRKEARSGVVNWPQENGLVSKHQEHNTSRSFRDVIDQILLWFNDPTEPINFGAIYHREPDHTGHRFGPLSVNMAEAVRQCDEHLGYLLDRIDASEKLRQNLHLMVTSDHGMEQINGTDHPIYYEDYIDGIKVKGFGIPSVWNIFVQSPNDIENVKKNLSKIPHATVYRRKDIPDRFHYKNHERVGDLLLLFEPGYEMVHKPTPGGKTYDYSRPHGNHGYDNQVESMKGIFYAAGPQFMQNFVLDNSISLYNTDLFGLMCIVLNVETCPPSNGSLANVQPFLERRKIKLMDFLVYWITLTGFSLIASIGLMWPIMLLVDLWKRKFPAKEEHTLVPLMP